MRELLKKHGLSIAMIIGTAATLAIAGFTSFAEECERIPDEVLRLHIIANSDSEEDQRFKYSLRDELLSTFSPELGGCDTLESAENASRKLLPEIERRACEFAAENGYPRDDIKAEITQMYFTTRVYERFTLPAGNYTALRVTIGDGKGENWWCVMFPPLCVPAVVDNHAADAINFFQTADNGDNSENTPKIKFALYEFLSGLLKS